MASHASRDSAIKLWLPCMETHRGCLCVVLHQSPVREEGVKLSDRISSTALQVLGLQLRQQDGPPLLC